jgi:hypothetical protein
VFLDSASTVINSDKEEPEEETLNDATAKRHKLREECDWQIGKQ